ncbi:maleylpyruvate isomerase family mycothiol-dependent enzyme [Nocardioides houyundeii]|uniref:maleylpyruvate isomerase family mycothiol-dependent enzyme n=1 Tax=Nocardioides houyundeii TaxID=2045452 RepID=UPI000C755F1B|nr:maleylpyruvate isomerase family mycothiol-dependent enzyme [Nocardioides houyundeii]
MTEQRETTTATTDEASRELAAAVTTWWQAVNDFTTLLEELDDDDWARPTDLPGWDVHAVAAHTAHLESLLVGTPHAEVELVESGHLKSPMGTFTEQGVVARRDASPDQLINEIRESATSRNTALLADPPRDPDAVAPGLFGAIGWSTRTLLRNRPLDVWMHEQDVRRAVGRPGNLDSPAARHSAEYLAESLGFVLAKKVRAPVGTTVALEVAGLPRRVACVAPDGRGRLLAETASDEIDATIHCDLESFLLLAGGRRRPEPGLVRVGGDTDLGLRVVESLAVTP